MLRIMVLMEEIVLGSKLFIDCLSWKNGCIPHLQGGPEIKYHLQEGMSGKRHSLATPSGPLDASLARRTLFWATWPQVTFAMWEGWHMSQARNLVVGSRL